MNESLSPQLELARKWLIQLNCGVEVMPADLSVGRPFTALGVTRAMSKFLVFETEKGVLVVTLLVSPGTDVRDVANSLSHEAQVKMLDLVKSTLISDPRTGFDIIPADAARIGAVQAIRLEQLMRIDDGSVSSFNKFEDSIQSVVSGAVRVSNLYIAAFRPAGAARDKKGEKPVGPGYG